MQVLLQSSVCSYSVVEYVHTYVWNANIEMTKLYYSPPC